MSNEQNGLFAALEAEKKRLEQVPRRVVADTWTLIVCFILRVEQAMKLPTGTQVIQQEQNKLQMANAAVLQLQQEAQGEKDVRVREQYRLESDVKLRQAERDSYEAQLAQACAQVLDRDQTIVQLKQQQQQHTSQLNDLLRHASEELEAAKLARQVRVAFDLLLLRVRARHLGCSSLAAPLLHVAHLVIRYECSVSDSCPESSHCLLSRGHQFTAYSSQHLHLFTCEGERQARG